MKLKKLEISGFKSFLDKATIQFPAGISAVVGPNGCGKSNVVDALRWVMGEQSVKQLRGKAMEDVIFAGSNGKPPLNMAEVSLTLLNDNGSAPEELRDFTEIMVTRRLFRSGESAYLINKQPCRLKDIHNIFLGSGMGARTYAVVQQGNIGAITDAGPEERRGFIEEAAGVTRYKSRKIEALRKVNATQQNLLRLNDIISEIERQMNGLKRQAKKAERHKKYQKRIKTVDVHLSIRLFEDLSAKLDTTRALLKELNDTDSGHSSQLRKIDAAIEQIKINRWEKNQAISAQKSKHFETQRGIDRLETDLAHTRAEIERLASETKALEHAQTDLQAKNETIIAEIGQVETENRDLQVELQAAATALKAEEQASQDLNARLAALNGTLEKAKGDLMELVAQEARCKNIYQNASNNKESLKRRLKRADEEEALANREVARASKDEKAAAAELEDCRLAIEDLGNRIAAQRGELDAENQRLAQQVTETQTLEFERSKVKSQYAALKKMEESYEWYKDGVKAILKRSRPPADAALRENAGAPAPPGVVGVIADLIEPEAGYATAVEAVLGEALQYILVNDQQAGQEAIGFLQAEDAGRCGFIPLSTVKVLGGPGGAPDASRLLLNHVTIAPGHEAVAQALLGHVTVTDDLEQALALYNRNGSLQTVVTRDGQVVSHQGIMIGGSAEKLSGILAKKQELKQLHLQIAAFDRRLQKAHDAQQALETRVRGLEKQLQQAIEAQHAMTRRHTEAEKALYKAGEALKHARRHLEVVQLEQEQLLGEESDIDAEMVKYNRAIADISHQIKSAQERMAGTAQQIQDRTAEQERFNRKALDLKLRKTAANAQLENSSNTLRRLKLFQADGLKRLEQVAHEIKQKRAKLEENRLRTGDFDKRLAHMYGEMETLGQALARSEADYQEIENRLQENDAVISQIQTQREETLQKIRLIEVKASQQQLQLENIANRIEERYHQPLDVFRSLVDANDARLEMTVEAMEAELARLKARLERIGDVNLGAIKEYEELKTRYDFLVEQREDLMKALEDLHKVIRKINRITQKRFMETFDMVNAKLAEVFPRLFEGGSAHLELTEPNNPLETGVEYLVHPPGKKVTRMSLLSGGEKALSAIAFIFSIFLIKPASFCLMDEIDAPLDEANIFRFNNLLKIIGEKSQIVMITHNKNSMEFADTLFGITMEQKGISKVVSVNFDRPN